MVNLTELENGNLKITLEEGGLDELETILERTNDERIHLVEMLDIAGYIGNDWYSPDEIGLTEAPAVARGASYPNQDNDEGVEYEKLWYFGDYMIVSFTEILKKEGSVVFTLAE